MHRPDLLELTSRILAAYVSNHAVAREDLAVLMGDIFRALKSFDASASPPPQGLRPAVPIAASVLPDYIICLEDGRRLKMLKRYLRTHFDMSPEEYREKWDLPPDYPMVAPNYALVRSEHAKEIGLGRKR